MTHAHDDNDPTRTHLVLTAGQAIHQYRIVERIGSGGMGTVYLADDASLNRRVALKFMPTDRVNDEAYRGRFIREAQAAAALNHPNVVHIYEVSEFKGHPFFAMEHVDGRTLREYVTTEPLELAVVLDLMIGVCDGLQKAHEQGVVHRDVKPQNIVVDRDGRPKVVDFGLAAVRGGDKLTREGTTVGTVAYMSPEQVAGKQVDARSDLFSVGVVLYELLTGQSPFRRENDAATLSAIRSDDPEPLARYRRSIPDGLQQVVDKALDKDSSTRYQSASGMKADLIREKRLLESGVSVSRSVSQAGAGGSTRKAKVIVPSVVAIGILVAVLILRPWQLEIRPSNDAQAAEQRLAVMYFDNLVEPDDPQRLGEIVTNLLITDLSESDQMRVVSSQRLYDILGELGETSDRSISRDLASRIAERAQARWMLTGTILQTEPHLVVTAQVIDVGTGQVEASERITGKPGEDIFVQTDRLAGAIRRAMQLGVVSATQDPSLAEVAPRSPEAYRLFLEGVEAFRQLFHARAVEKIDSAIALDSTFAEAYFYSATRLQDYPENRRYIKLAIKHSDHASPLLRRKIESASDEIFGRPHQALEKLRATVKEYPDDVESYVGIHALLLKLNRRPEAIETLEKVISIDPRERHALNQLAYLCKRERRLNEALAWADRYLEVAPYEPNPYDTRGEILADMGRVEEALSSFEKAFEVDTMFQAALMHAFFVHCFESNFDSAAALVERLDGHTSVDAEWNKYEAKSAIAELTGRLREALVVHEQFIVSHWGQGAWSTEVRAAMGYKNYIHSRLGEYDSVLVNVAKMEAAPFLEGHWTRYESLATRALSLARLGRESEAMAAVDTIQQIVAGEPQWHIQARLTSLRAQVAQLLGNYDAAVELCDSAIALRGDYESHLADVASQAYMAVGRESEAIAILKPFLSSMPEVDWVDVALINCRLGQHYEAINKPADAREHYAAALERWSQADGSDPLYRFAKERHAALSTSP